MVIATADGLDGLTISACTDFSRAQVGPVSFRYRIFHEDITFEGGNEPGNDVIRYRTRHVLTLLDEGVDAVQHHWKTRLRQGNHSLGDAAASCFDPVASVDRTTEDDMEGGRGDPAAAVPTTPTKTQMLHNQRQRRAHSRGGIVRDAASPSSTMTPLPNLPADDDEIADTCRQLEPPPVPIRLSDVITSVYTAPYVLDGLIRNHTVFLDSEEGAGLIERLANADPPSSFSPLFARKTVAELLFGFADPYMEFINEHISSQVPAV